MKWTLSRRNASQSLSLGALITLVGVPLRKARMSSTASPKNILRICQMVAKHLHLHIRR